MTDLATGQLREPYLILIGSEDDPTCAKTCLGIIQWMSWHEKLSNSPAAPPDPFDAWWNGIPQGGLYHCHVGHAHIYCAAGET